MKLGVVLPAGGARAAYQVGVLKYIGKTFPHLAPKIFSGVSAGSINATYLAQGDPFEKATENLFRLWERIEFKQVLDVKFRSIFSMLTRSAYDLFVSKVTRRLLVRSLLDASPLSHTLLSHVHFWKISRAIRSGKVEGLAISATNYHNGMTTIFFDSTSQIEPWHREQRIAIRTSIRVRHIMASCSIPILFEPIRIGDYLYGDGSLRFSFPLSPAIKLGASHLLAIGIRCPTPENQLGFRPEQASLGFVFGAILNSIFLDSLEADYENLCRINRAHSEDLKKIPVMLLRPSHDLGSLAREFIDEVPFHLRQLLRSTASKEEIGDLLSYLMFSPGYVRTLMDLGMRDAEAQKDKLYPFFADNHNKRPAVI